MRHEASRRPRVVGELARPVFFVGFMGAGKTSVARRLARTCGVASVDMDTYLERREGKRVKEIFAQAGEDGFRAIETDVLRELAGKEPLLVSCGGGVVKRDENRAILRDAGFVVYLKVTADEAKSRIRRSGIVVMQYPEGVDFGEERAQLVIGIAGAGDEHIEILARVTSALEDEEVLRRLKTTDDPRYILEKLAI